MKTNLITFLIMPVFVLFAGGCAIATAHGIKAEECLARVKDEVNARGNHAETDAINERNRSLLIGPEVSYDPMPAEFLDYLEDGAFAFYWGLFFEGLDRSDPPHRIHVILNYSAGAVPPTEPYLREPSLTGCVTGPGMGIGLSHSFPTTEPFLTLIDYLAEHEDVFFDHSEFSFQDVPQGWTEFARRASPQKEFFTFGVSPYHSNSANMICKFADFDTDTPKEVFLAIEKIKLLFTDPILGQSPPANRDPVCDLEDVDDYETEWGTPVTVTFDATNSYDLDFDTLTYAWDFDGDEVYGENPDDNYSGQPDNPTHIYDLPVGEHYMTVSVKVTDPDDAESICETSFTITVEMTEAR